MTPQRAIIPATDPILRAHASEVDPADIPGDHIQTLIRDMRELLAREHLGVAIAAPQVGESLRLFVVSGRALLPDEDEHTEKKSPKEPVDDLVFINPVIIKTSRRKKDMHEGCLSLPGFWGMVPRSERTTIQALDEKGQPITRGASGLLAHIFQHEIDHLEGVMYTDKAHDVYEEAWDEKTPVTETQ